MRFPDVPSTSIKLMLFPFSLEDLLNSAAGGNFLDKMPRECLKIIESKSKVRNSRNKAVVAKVSSNSSTPGISPDVAALTTEGDDDNEKKRQEVKKIVEAKAKRQARITACLKNFRVIQKESISSDKTPKVSLVFAVTSIEPKDSLIMGDEHFSTSRVEEIVPIPKEYEDFLNNNKGCDLSICNDNMIFSNPLVKSKDDLASNDDSILKKDVQKEDFQIYSNPLFEFDNLNSSNENPLFNEMEDDVENEKSKVVNELVLPHTLFSDKVECFNPGDDIDEIEAFLATEVSSNFEEGYYDSEGDVLSLESLLYDDTTHNPSPEVIFDHNSNHETSITFSPRNDPLHHEFAGGIITNPSSVARKQEEYLVESLPTLPILVEESDPVQEEIDLLLVPDNLTPPGVENDDSEDEPENESSILDPSIPRPPPEPPDVCLSFEPVTAIKKYFGVLKIDDCFNPERSVIDTLSPKDDNSFTFFIWTFLPYFTYSEGSPLILSFGSEDFVFDPGISAYSFFSHKPVVFHSP
ncbi:hypothetical protein Tco_1174174 [Tanacetum coccineum]